MLLVYTYKITPRLKYTFKQICTGILGIPVTFTTTIEDFIAHDKLKISYSKQPLSNELFIRSNELLFEQGLEDLDINVQIWNQTKCFFATSDKSALPFDIFAASFYLLSRYEEYLPHVKDEYGRFTAKESLAFKHGFLKQPVVDIWAFEFLKVLKQFYPDYKFNTRTFSIKPVIDVPAAYNYKLKGIMRTVGGTLKDLVKFKFSKLYNRYLVVLGLKRDPYDSYRYIINKQKQTKFKFIIFFLLGDYSTYDKGINIQKQKYVSLIKQMADYCDVGLKSSYFALTDIAVLKKEKIRMEQVVNSKLKATRQSFSKLNLPESYRNMVDLEIFEDYTMGYTDKVGFRAGTCTPFFFYDLDYETHTPLKIYTYHVLDFALLSQKSLLDKKRVLNKIISEVKNVNGKFTPVFHNYTFGDDPKWKGYKDLFNIILQATNE